MDLGTELGVVSLGLTVCQGLLDYYKSWQTYRDDIRSTSASIGHLLQLLYQIREILNSKTEGHQATLMSQVDKAAKNCASNLRVLNDWLQKIRPFDDAQSIRNKLRNRFQRLDYPFQKETLKGLEGEVAKSRTSLLEVLNVLQVQQNSDLEGMVQKLFRNQVEAEVRKWPAAPDPSINQNSNLDQRHADTCLWFLSCADYAQWQNHDQSSLWLQGSAGSGKTVLCSTIVDDMQRFSAMSSGSTVYYYFTFADDVKTKVSGFLRSTLLQLSECYTASPSILDSLYKTYKGATPPDVILLDAI